MGLLRGSSLPASSPVPPELALDDAWKDLTRRANIAFQASDDVLARALYEAALREAERVLELACVDGPADAVALGPMLLTISCQNLAQLTVRAGASAATQHLLVHAFECLFAIASASQARLDLRASAARHLGIASTALVQHLCEHGSPELADAHAERAKAVIQAVSLLVAAATVQ